MKEDWLLKISLTFKIRKMMKQMMKINNKMYKILLLVKLESKEQKVMKMLMMPIVLLMKELKIDLLMKTMVKNK